MKKQSVVVTTQHRGVFVGETTDAHTADPIRLTNARMVVHWDQSTRGVLGIATKGLGKSSRVTDAVHSLVLRNVTAVYTATPEAVKTWELAPWG